MKKWTCNCPICGAEKSYVSERNLKNFKDKPCRSCANSISGGGIGNVKAVDGKKRCNTCQELKLIEHFYTRNDGKTYSTHCKECSHKINREYHKNTHRFKKYGLTKEDFNKLSKKQNGKCAICNKKTNLYIDHCHTNKHVRGLLCQKCNSALGLLQDNINILTNAINYLRKNG